ncbi:RNA 2',3'-cyclic phosphodiesterase [Rhodovulum sp. YNF3179]|uniref:RNA 2',3'-cyclic phosphodiesterase n=1 Tax=Rhodovulum sp. YNF3179 TaxID=3425127 RepID=UPI003D343A60
MMRAFVAIDLPEAARTDLALLQQALPVGRAVPPENMHVTLVFLGEVPEPVLEDADAAFRRVAAPGFSLHCAGVGVFGGDLPRAVYAGISGTEPLCHLQAKLETAARGAGVTVAKRRFVPHVTLARPGGRVDRIALEHFIAGHAAHRGPEFEVADFRLYEATLGRKAARYTELARYPLTG